MIDYKVSIIVPIYNVEKYIKKCVDSILLQTYSNLEIILVNDGSTDKSAQICDEYKNYDKRIIVIHKSNRGLSDARNIGIDVATGDYLSFIDSDDFIHSRMIEILYNNLVETKSDISVCDFFSIYQRDNYELYEGENVIKIYPFGKDSNCCELQDIKDNSIACNKLFKKELFRNIRFPVGFYHEDDFVIHRIFYECNYVVFTKCKLYYYYQREGSISKNLSSKNIKDQLSAYQERIEFYRKVNYSNDSDHSFHIFYDYCVKYYVECKKVKDIDKNQIRKYIRKNFKRNWKKYGYVKRQKIIHLCECSFFAYNMLLYFGLINVKKAVKKLLK